MEDVPNWLSEVQNQGIPDSIEELEESVARFDDLHSAFNGCYNEVSVNKNWLSSRKVAVKQKPRFQAQYAIHWAIA